jgi:hypothetical protein
MAALAGAANETPKTAVNNIFLNINISSTGA